MDVGGKGQVHIDSARVTAVVDGQTTIYENPEVKTDDFPYTPTTEFESSNRRVVLEVPSSLTDAGTFDGLCRSNGRTLTIDLSFYAPQGDNGEGDPPLISTTGTLPLVPGGAPLVISTFASSGPMKVPSQLGVAPSLRLVPVGDEAIFISPYRAERELARSLFPVGEFVEIFVDTPIEICEQRDVKGLYARARAGKLPNFTGIDAPYEIPEAPELRLQTDRSSVEELADGVVEAAIERAG